MKMNLCKKHKGLAYMITPLEGDRARLDWISEVDVTANQAVGNGPKRKRRVEAAAWLAEMFAGVDELPSKTVYRRTEEDTELSADALREAKDDMGIRAIKKTDDEGQTAWWWAWPPGRRQDWQRKNGAPDEERV
jgi:hypothetical protein